MGKLSHQLSASEIGETCRPAITSLRGLTQSHGRNGPRVVLVEIFERQEADLSDYHPCLVCRRVAAGRSVTAFPSSLFPLDSAYPWGISRLGIPY